MRIVVTGATGLLGRALLREAAPSHAMIPVARTGGEGVHAIDVTAPSAATSIAALEPEVVVHAAALTDLALCERDPAAAARLNAEAPAALARASAGGAFRLVHVSTDYVYEGARGGYREDDAVAPPPGAYASTKWRGDRGVLDLDPSALVVRTSFFGRHPQPGRSNLAQWIHGELAAGRSVELVEDQRSSFIHSADAARAILRLAVGRASGPINVGLAAPASRLDLGLALARAFGLDASLIRPTTLKEHLARHPRPYPVPVDASMDVRRWRGTGATPPTLDETVQEMTR